jgi:hypothetical protein
MLKFAIQKKEPSQENTFNGILELLPGIPLP